MTETNGDKKYSRNIEVADMQRRMELLERHDDNLRRDIDETKKTPWPIYLTGASLFFTLVIGFAFIITTWITLRVDPLKEFASYNFGQIEKEFDQTRFDRRDMRDRFDEDIKLLRTEIDILRKSVYPLQVHDQRWLHYDDQIKTLQERDRETNHTIQQLYSPADKFKELDDRMNRLTDMVERKFMMNGGGTSPYPIPVPEEPRIESPRTTLPQVPE